MKRHLLRLQTRDNSRFDPYRLCNQKPSQEKQLATWEANGFQEPVWEAYLFISSYHSHSSLTSNMKSREGEKASAKVKGKKIKTAE